MTEGPQPHSVDHLAAMQQMLTGYELSQALFAVAATEIPTVLDRAGTLTLKDLAERAGVDHDALARLVRLLVTHGVFHLSGDRVSLTELGSTLSVDHPRSLHGIAIGAKNLHYLPFSELEHTLRTGQSAASKFYGVPYFEWISADPARTALFQGAMATFMKTLRKGIFDNYRLPAGEVIADIGGGSGHVLIDLLSRPENEHRRGILFDLPEVVDGIRAAMPASGPGDRIELVGGSFFEAVPTADIYLLGWVLHDWNDSDAQRILTTIARAARPGARLVVVEGIVPDGDQAHPIKAMDVTMLAILGGQERTEEQYRRLLATARFNVDAVVPTPSPFSVLEATLR
ncbi:methyltransferase [Catenuloplanes sp. NPDC051500]|uniref:methyltransferase n=1 Tax=Catenuloplanes sp. NPDC051500 TaxID=3363959 RepID=UPI0037AEC2D4